MLIIFILRTIELLKGIVILCIVPFLTLYKFSEKGLLKFFSQLSIKSIGYFIFVNKFDSYSRF